MLRRAERPRIRRGSERLRRCSKDRRPAAGFPSWLSPCAPCPDRSVAGRNGFDGTGQVGGLPSGGGTRTNV